MIVFTMTARCFDSWQHLAMHVTKFLIADGRCNYCGIENDACLAIDISNACKKIKRSPLNLVGVYLL